MQVYGLVGQTEEGIWPEAQLRAIYLPRSDQPVGLFKLHISVYVNVGRLAQVPEKEIGILIYKINKIRKTLKILRCFAFRSKQCKTVNFLSNLYSYRKSLWACRQNEKSSSHVSLGPY